MKKWWLFAVGFLLNYSSAVAGQGDDLRSGRLQPRLGVMSEEVVREKFRSYGIEPSELKRVKNGYTVYAHIEGNLVEFQVDNITGAIKRRGESVRLRSADQASTLLIKPKHDRVPWVQRAIPFEKIGVEGLRDPAQPPGNSR